MIAKLNLLLKQCLFVICLIVVTQAHSQQESANWFFGEKAALSFNSNSPVSIANSSLETHEGSATISDEQGNLLFYTDGVTIWDKRNRAMPNGYNLFGNKSSTMSALIIPKPGTINRYYVFTIDEPGKSKENFDDGKINGVNYSEVDMTLNSGYGDVILKNQPLITYDVNNETERYFKSSEKITAVTHDDEISIWVITHLGNTFYSFLIDELGVNENPVTSTVSTNIIPRVNSDSINVTAIGYLKVSPNGKNIAIAHSSTALGSPRTGTKRNGKVFLYDFNTITGTVTSELLLSDGLYPYGLEFSPNSKLLYTTVGHYNTDDSFREGYLYQYDVKSSDIPGSEVLINTSNYYAGALQLAIDGKIYRTGYTGTAGLNTLSLIDNPNTIGTDCNYRHGRIHLDYGRAKLGLPPFVQSIFKYRFNYTYTCAGSGFEATFNILPDPSEEDPDYKMSWDFGDGETSTSSATHYYAVPGDYEVSMELSINGEIQTYKKTITIAEEPTLDTNYELIACDAFDADANDGLTYFNLQNLSANSTIFTTDLVQVYFYETLVEATIANKLDAINGSFQNSVENQIVYANVYADHSDCFQTVEVKLTTKDPVSVGEFTLKACQTITEGIALFDLSETFINSIRTASGFSNDVAISFHSSRVDAQNGANPLPPNYESADTTIYIKAESSSACYDVGKVNLRVNYFPILADRVYNVCPSEFPITIDSGIRSSTYNTNSYTYSWDGTGTRIPSTNDELEVHAAGEYYVTIYDTALNCDATVRVSVVEFPAPMLKDFKVDNYNLTINLLNPGNNFEYAVDYLNGFQDSNVFRNLSAGEHKFYVRDKFRCNLIEETFYVFGLPKYFTPNGDGIHDIWKVEGLDPSLFTQPIDVYVFDRYGKIITRFDALNSEGWDGTLNGTKLLPDDYWYHLVLPNGREYRGHFTLKY
ncbi:PKD domain-containing protein [Formosa agariphila KMM 3901]|uniref:PKD domain-containing protein n=1 Tax=Formosa agariphila (strain DSM 15362 / KCTC 12365 / LMG 23005 / KMM 3901 / M-2Alg 35-1) TaxID=1347342 RepID=T2KLZ7_FORAG|nr:T9SS type B sorting domain-containing protein [Formosa agariphila]CDF79024.1 PKD domain-containing protein [Formosa agariphila KMM 3901]